MAYPSQPPSAPPDQRSLVTRFLGQLWFQVIIGLALGILVGAVFPHVGESLAPLNDWFIALIKMIVVPVIFCVIVAGISSMDSLGKAGRIGVKAISYFLVFSLLSMLIGFAVGAIFKPGRGMHIDVSSLSTAGIPADELHTGGFTDFVSSLIPDNLLGGVTGGNVLAALVVSLLFGAALNLSGDQGRPLVAGINALQNVLFRIVGWIMRLSPIAVFGALASVVATTGLDSLRSLAYLIVLFAATCVVYVVVVLGLVMRACGLSIFGLLGYLKEELIVVLSTCSSESVLPQVIRRMENLGVGKPVVGITIPSGYSFNLDGSALYLTMGFLFLAQATDTHLSWEQQLVMIGVMMLMSKGTAGVAGGAFVILASTVTSVGTVPVAALALIVGIDRILNEGRVFINVLGNSVAAIVIAKWEKDFDQDRARRILAGRGRDLPGESLGEETSSAVRAGGVKAERPRRTEGAEIAGG
ncbi:MAG TPA: cation:dicarboxylase symporter family transporter [Flexivirga sp.]|uniref:cation:dicarboxylate symporter family transporter n=1 Tax=Flexivirga sp. TaxID=1962927 RepID=UPI002BF994D8|nr:cation:dicarboxylase symporter family transporter [Flexivirga sp.]HWC24856.1 cation:dicarboxylase symporter family transporter [Flexivirga sp.]